MTSSGNTVPPLIPDATPSQVAAILGAMRAVAETGAPASEADRHAITSAGRYLFGHKNTGFDAIAPVAPQALVSALGGSRLGEDAAKFLTVMALVDGTLDKTKISTVLRYAQALGLHERYLDDIAAAAADRLQEALADMTRSNMESITGLPLARRRHQQMAPALRRWPGRCRARGAICRARAAGAGYVRACLLGALQGQQLHLPWRSDRAECGLQCAARFGPRAERL